MRRLGLDFVVGSVLYGIIGPSVFFFEVYKAVFSVFWFSKITKIALQGFR
jgi:hypothetical protein